MARSAASIIVHLFLFNLLEHPFSLHFPVSSSKIRVGFADSSALANNPGWHLRNFLVLLKRQWKVNNVKVFCYRELAGKGDISKSIVVDVDLSEADFSGAKFPFTSSSTLR